MKVLLVYPEFPITYWGFQYGLKLAGKKSALPPLGLISLAALLPKSWEIRLVDLNIEPLPEADLEWADIVFVGGMRVQGASIHDVIARARKAGRRVAVGGPAPTTAPEEYPDADIVFCGEAEGRIAQLEVAIEAAKTCPDHYVLTPSGDRPSVQLVPTPRYDLLKRKHYRSMSIQYSRGCPFQCEFCDIIEIFGRVPRVKTTDQILAEMDALYDGGYRGSLFFVDDNFIGNKATAKQLLPVVAQWQKDRGHPFDLYTEASVNLAADPELIKLMTEAGFTSVFLGIESPSPEALKAAKKYQNVNVDLPQAIDRLTRSGLQVMGGFIVGLDQDTPDVFDAQREFINSSPVALSMVGLLIALPGTGLWRRLEREGRMREQTTGDQFGRPNFVPAMDEETLLRGYRQLLADIYSVDAYYDRCEAFIERTPPAPGRKSDFREAMILFRTAWTAGRPGRHGWRFWRLMLKATFQAPHTFGACVGMAVMGEHLIRYTKEEVLPRLDLAIEAVQREKAIAAKAVRSEISPATPWVMPGAATAAGATRAGPVA